jgi:tetratricopeptide (TPR) repeat protein
MTTVKDEKASFRRVGKDNPRHEFRSKSKEVPTTLPTVGAARIVRESARSGYVGRICRRLSDIVQSWRRSFHTFKGTTSQGERWLLLALTIYVLTLGAFLWLTWHERENLFLRYSVTLMTLCLALLIPDVMSKRRLSMRIWFMCIPTLGLAFLQAESEARLTRVSRQMTERALDQVRMLEIKSNEAHLAEEFPLEPLEAIENGENADEGFLIKANRLRIGVFEREADLLVERPDLSDVIFKLPDDPRARLKAYEHIRSVRPSLAATTSDVFSNVRNVVAYLDTADLFRREIKPEYRRLESAIKRKVLSTSEVCERLSLVSDRLNQFVQLHPTAGLYNHIGNIALNCGKKEVALASFYFALGMDSSHITAYESLSYGLWILSKDSANALGAADRGLLVCQQERSSLQAAFDRAVQTYEFFERSRPTYAPLIARKIRVLEREINKSNKEWTDFLDDLTNRLANDYAYFSALELKNEKEARTYITDLYKGNPDIPEYEDSMGFVLMRFARSKLELERAKELFVAAVTNPNAGPETARLASAHLQELVSYQRVIDGYDSKS